jgi:hypothetical protein
MPLLDPSRRLKFSVNPSIIDKNQAGANYAHGFQNVEFTISELADSIDRGVAFCSQLTGARRASFFQCSDIFVAAFDGSRTISEVLDDPFVRENASLLYTTQRHSSGLNRFRLVFALPNTINCPIKMRAALRSLSLQLTGNLASTDPAHLYFGSKGSSPRLLHRELSADTVDSLIRQGLHADTRIKNDRGAMTTVSQQTVEPDAAVKLEDGREVILSSLSTGTRVCCPFHYDRNGSAFVTESKSDNRGIHCLVCRQTFWTPDNREEFDFLDFDKQVANAEQYFAVNQDPGPLMAPISSGFQPGLKECRIHRQAGGFCELGSDLPVGLNFIKSPKGTGKTQALSHILSGDVNRVLLIGHRIALIEQTCGRLDLECYLEQGHGEIHGSRMGICLDSLGRLALPGGANARKPFIDYLIIDESEQVLAHFLSDTIKAKDRNQLFQLFRALVRGSKRVVALDADLGHVSFETLSKMATEPDKGYVPKRSHLFINECTVNSSVEVYGTKAQLIGELKNWAANGRRLFVPSNSKKLLGKLKEGLQNDLPCVRTLLVTSDTTGEPEVKRFIASPKTEYRNYDVILASPTLGTGIDIKFDNDEQVVDAVFGFFETGVSTHFEIDQQIWRVRHPKCVKAWVSPVVTFFDTSRDVIKRDIQAKNLYKNTLSHYDSDMRPVYHTNDALIDMAALVRSQQVASKNNLKNNFIAMKERHGHKILHVGKEAATKASGVEFEKRARLLEEARYREGILQAPSLTHEEFEELDTKNRKGAVGRAEKYALERYRIERFYVEPVSNELLNVDKRGRFQTKVALFENVQGVGATNGTTLPFGLKDRFIQNNWRKGELIHHLLTRAGVIEGSEFKQEFEFNSRTLEGFMDECWALRLQIEGQIEIAVRSEKRHGVAQLSRILGKIGLGVQQTHSSRAILLAGGNKVRFYRVRRANLSLVQKIVERRAARSAQTPAHVSSDKVLSIARAPNVIAFPSGRVLR